MKRFAALALVAFFATACTTTENAAISNQDMVCEQCACCQKMMNNGMMKQGTQCPTMQDAAKDNKTSGCYEATMKDGLDAKSTSAKPAPLKAANDGNHKAHHPQK